MFVLLGADDLHSSSGCMCFLPRLTNDWCGGGREMGGRMFCCFFHVIFSFLLSKSRIIIILLYNVTFVVVLTCGQT